MTQEDTLLLIENGKEVTLLFTAATDYNPQTLGFDRSVDPEKECLDILTRAERKSYRQLYTDHVRDHSALFNRVSLQLPALPQAWDHGEVRGLKARGDFRVDIKWKEHKPEQVTVHAGKKIPVEILYGDKKYYLTPEKGMTYTFNGNLKPIKK